MKSDGTDRRRLTFSADAERYVNVSPDGKKLVVVSQRTDNAAARELLTMHVDGTNSRVVASTGLDATTLAFPAFSPDGRTIAYMSNVSSDPGTYGIWTVSVSGGKATRLTPTTVSALHPSWSPDGSRIVYTSGLVGSGKFDLYIMNADGSNPQLLRQCTDWCENPVWSPDGSKIFYLEQDWDSIEIEYCDLVPAVPFCGNLIPHQGTPSTLSLSPDGSMLVYSSQTYDITSVHRIVTSNVNGSGQTVLTANLFALTDAAWGR
jgi:Tol biopolymer transport system component